MFYFLFFKEQEAWAFEKEAIYLGRWGASLGLESGQGPQSQTMSMKAFTAAEPSEGCSQARKMISDWQTFQSHRRHEWQACQETCMHCRDLLNCIKNILNMHFDSTIATSVFRTNFLTKKNTEEIYAYRGSVWCLIVKNYNLTTLATDWLSKL